MKQNLGHTVCSVWERPVISCKGCGTAAEVGIIPGVAWYVGGLLLGRGLVPYKYANKLPQVV